MAKQVGADPIQLVSFKQGIPMKYLLMVIALLYLIGCTTSKSVTKQDSHSDAKYDESFDPMSLDDNDIEFPSAIRNKDANNTNTTTNNIIQDVQKEVNGFRIQIIATQDLEKATLLEEQAKSQFSVNGHKTYLVFEAPLYKIRLGDFTTRNQADELKIQALKYGYREAFIVRTKVILNAEDGMQEL
jgi:sporulation related protein